MVMAFRLLSDKSIKDGSYLDKYWYLAPVRGSPDGGIRQPDDGHARRAGGVIHFHHHAVQADHPVKARIAWLHSQVILSEMIYLHQVE